MMIERQAESKGNHPSTVTQSSKYRNSSYRQNIKCVFVCTLLSAVKTECCFYSVQRSTLYTETRWLHCHFSPRSCFLSHLCQMPCFLPRVWSCEWIWERMSCCMMCNNSLRAFEISIPPHFASCILIERLVSVLSWIANHCQSTSNNGCRSNLMRKTVTSNWKIQFLVKTAARTGPQTCHPGTKDLFLITNQSLTWGILGVSWVFWIDLLLVSVFPSVTIWAEKPH